VVAVAENGPEQKKCLREVAPVVGVETEILSDKDFCGLLGVRSETAGLRPVEM
jgi:hypothetical protein